MTGNTIFYFLGVKGVSLLMSFPELDELINNTFSIGHWDFSIRLFPNRRYTIEGGRGGESVGREGI